MMHIEMWINFFEKTPYISSYSNHTPPVGILLKFHQLLPLFHSLY